MSSSQEPQSSTTNVTNTSFSPGTVQSILDPQFLDQLSIAWAYSYSRRWNQRRIEAHHYMAWVLVLIVTFHNLRPRFSICPQFTFSTLDDETLTSSRESNYRVGVPKVAEVRGKLAKALQEAAEEKRLLEKLLEQTETISPQDEQGTQIQSIGHVFNTRKAVKSEILMQNDRANALLDAGLSRTPDFVVVLFLGLQCRLTQKPYPLFSIPELNAWERLRISESIIPSVWEIKRNPPRGLPDKDAYANHLFGIMSTATNQVMDQGALALKSQPSLRYIILVVASGEWWMWKIMKRPEPSQLDQAIAVMKENRAKKKDPQDVKDNFQETKKYVVDDPEDPGEKNDQTFKPDKRTEVPKSDRNLRLKKDTPREAKAPEKDLDLTFPRHLDIGLQAEVYPGSLDSFKQYMLEAPAGDWTAYLRMGSQASDQSLALIRELHKDFLDEHDAKDDLAEEESPPNSPIESDLGADPHYRARSPTQKTIGLQTK